ncbi:MAG: hypothetical protein QOK47_1492 [Actinomycetota bacterium]|jgi:hypothetical protein|nr:hypothetical protein [Actinomycetota bacterium]
MKRFLKLAAMFLIVFFLLIQLVPYGREATIGSSDSSGSGSGGDEDDDDDSSGPGS